VALLLCGLCALPVRAEHPQTDFRLSPGDRVALVGGTLVEREQAFGYWETLLTAACRGGPVTFRNLGWSGDTVWGESRGLFEPHLGYERLLEHVRAVEPTLVIMAYGQNEAFAGEEELMRFLAQYGNLLDDLTAPGRRFVLVGPLLMDVETGPVAHPGWRDIATRYNVNVAAYSDGIRKLAEMKRHSFIDLTRFQLMGEEQRTTGLTINGLHLSEAGYQQSARWLASSLHPMQEGDGERLACLVQLDYELPAVRALREAIVAKNELFFHRWRPQNFTYLYGFRQHEQGQNAVEVPRFDPLVEASEQTVFGLSAPICP
jgi:lysophospholipase L1-like esterase